jgi:hypothetical protein
MAAAAKKRKAEKEEQEQGQEPLQQPPAQQSRKRVKKEQSEQSPSTAARTQDKASVEQPAKTIAQSSSSTKPSGQGSKQGAASKHGHEEQTEEVFRQAALSLRSLSGESEGGASDSDSESNVKVKQEKEDAEYEKPKSSSKNTDTSSSKGKDSSSSSASAKDNENADVEVKTERSGDDSEVDSDDADILLKIQKQCATIQKSGSGRHERAAVVVEVTTEVPVSRAEAEVGRASGDVVVKTDQEEIAQEVKDGGEGTSREKEEVERKVSVDMSVKAERSPPEPAQDKDNEISSEWSIVGEVSGIKMEPMDEDDGGEGGGVKVEQEDKDMDMPPVEVKKEQEEEEEKGKDSGESDGGRATGGSVEGFSQLHITDVRSGSAVEENPDRLAAARALTVVGQPLIGQPMVGQVKTGQLVGQPRVAIIQASSSSPSSSTGSPPSCMAPAAHTLIQLACSAPPLSRSVGTPQHHNPPTTHSVMSGQRGPVVVHHVPASTSSSSTTTFINEDLRAEETAAFEVLAEWSMSAQQHGVSGGMMDPEDTSDSIYSSASSMADSSAADSCHSNGQTLLLLFTSFSSCLVIFFINLLDYFYGALSSCEL